MFSRRGRRWFVPLGAVFVIVVATLATMSWSEPPRFDGAGYATLGRALTQGQSYRVISEPDAPLHAHFPPAYPITLALLWGLAGTKNQAAFTGLAHAESVVCMVVGVWAFARWWALVEPRRVAICLTLALAVNWTWIRTGGVIRSEPLAIALSGLTLLVAQPIARINRKATRLGLLSGLLGVGILTRQVAVCWSAAVALDLAIRAGWRVALALLSLVVLVVTPWLGWQLWVGSGSQSSLFESGHLSELIAHQALFYARRIPDVVLGPFVEVATVFGQSTWLASLASVGAIACTVIVGLGWVRSVRVDRQRLGGLVPLTTLPLLLVWPFTEAGRFLIPLVPFVLMGAVNGGAILCARFHLSHPKLWASRLLLAGSIPYSVYAVLTQRAEAERHLQRDFDAACAWVSTQRGPSGPVMARHAADAAWLTGRFAVPIPEGGPAAIAASIRKHHVAFLLIDDARYARSPDNPLHNFVTGPPPIREVWRAGDISVALPANE